MKTTLDFKHLCKAFIQHLKKYKIYNADMDCLLIDTLSLNDYEDRDEMEEDILDLIHNGNLSKMNTEVINIFFNYEFYKKEYMNKWTE
jgi:hypothetical protein